MLTGRVVLAERRRLASTGHCRASQETATRRTIMNWDRIEGEWKQMKGSVKEQWGKLTDDDLDVAAGKRDQLVGKIQNRYGIAKDEAEKQIDDWAENHKAAL
jgi:uncharacterized protein YjbJ (UPF0337 family)